jgi:ABC-type Fe3+ transport system substrate-binding protein
MGMRIFGRRALLFVCGFIAATASARALTQDEIFNYKGADRQQVLEDGARKEGTVVLYSAMIVNQALRPLTDAFRKKYPFIDIKYWRGDDHQIVSKLIVETQANALVADVVEGSGVSGGLGATQIVAPYHSQYSAEMPANAIAPDRTWLTTRYRYIGLGYNTKFVRKEDAPKTYEDLLDPKWKGKMAWSAQSSASGALIIITALRAAWGEDKAAAYFEKLAGQQVAPLAMSNRAVVDRLVEGEYQIGIGISAHHPIISARKGAPSDTIMLEPTPALSDAVQVLRAAKHPHAAMLLIDFMLSPECQTLLQQADYFPSNPNVQPSEALQKIVPRNAGVKEVIVTPAMIEHDTARSGQLLEKYFKK